MLSIPELKKVKDVMDTEFSSISEDSSITDAIEKMIKCNRRALIVFDEYENIRGIISMTDMHNFKGDFYGLNNTGISEIMKKNVVSVEKGISIEECRDIMVRENIGLLPVLEKGKVIGVLRPEHIRDYFYMNLEDYGITVNHVIERVKEGIFAVNKDGKVILWNKFMENRYDIRASEIIGKSIKDFLDDTITEKVLETKTGISDIYRYESGNMYGLVQSNPIYVSNEFVGVVSTELDITEAKKLSSDLEHTTEKLEYLQNEVKNLSNGVFSKILGNSPNIEKAKTTAKQVAKTNSSIFIWGESGTGKEVFSRAIHEYSERKGSFIPVNCSAIPRELFESEFFGYEPGAFTGASKKGKAGIFELAKDGTVFLDEIADLPLSMQAKLLRVLQEKEVRRIGGDKVIKINPRIISATNKDLEKMIKEETFREDLYYRLNVVEIKIPALRNRKEDIRVLLHHFIKEMCEENNKPVMTLSKEAYKILENYKWKGNIRELKNTVENIVVLSNKSVVEKDDIPGYIIESLNEGSNEDEYPMDLVKATTKLEIKNIKKALEMSNGNKAKAAKILNIPRTTLYYKIEQYGIK